MTSLHQKQWQFLKKTVELGKIPHALLFYGQNSSDKMATALEFVKLLNCQSERCRQDIEKNIHPDLYIIEPKDKEIEIDQIRELHSRLSLRAYGGRHKTVIIKQAHRLNQEAQSAFLKLLEEPKGKTVFILITEYPEILMPTVLSRVERLRFYSGVKAVDPQEKRIKDILHLSRADLVQRFQYAKTLSEDPQSLEEALDVWLKFFRGKLLEAVNRSLNDDAIAKLRKILQLMQSIRFLISTTNVNPRLALEILMLGLELEEDFCYIEK